MVEHFNNVSQWVIKNILAQNDAKLRTKILNKFLKLGEKLKKLNNMNGVMEILSGLENAAVFRLKKSWEKANNEIYESLSSLLASSQNHSEYRKTLREHVTPPAVPYLGIFLSDLTFIEEGNKDFLPSPLDNTIELINFEKRRKYSHVIQDIKLFQYPYNLDVDEHLRKALDEQLKRPHLSDVELYNISLEIEPRDGAASPATTSEALKTLRKTYAPPPSLNFVSARNFTASLKSFTFGRKRGQESAAASQSASQSQSTQHTQEPQSSEPTHSLRSSQSSQSTQSAQQSQSSQSVQSSQSMQSAESTQPEKSAETLSEVKADQKIQQLKEVVDGIHKYLKPETQFIADYIVKGDTESTPKNSTPKKEYTIRIVTNNIIPMCTENGKVQCPHVYAAESTRFIFIADSDDVNYCCELESTKEKHHLFIYLKDATEKEKFSKDVRKVLNEYKREKLLKEAAKKRSD